MAFDRTKFFILLLCATILVGAFSNAKANVNLSNVHIGVFNSKEDAQNFYGGLPDQIKSHIDSGQLWLDVYKSNKGFLEHHINISNLTGTNAKALCKKIVTLSVQCITSGLEPLFDKESTVLKDPALSTEKQDNLFNALGLRLHNDTGAPVSLAFNPALLNDEGSRPFTKAQQSVTEGQNFTLMDHIDDTLEVQAAKAAYDVARSKFVAAVQSIGAGVNAGQGDEAAKQSLLTLGREAFEAAGSAYLSGFLQSNKREANILASDAGSGEVFIHHVKKNLSSNARANVDGLIVDVLSGAVGDDVLSERTDDLMLSGARGVIDAGLLAARRSDLYALRHLELEYNLNDFDTSYISVLTTQPVYQSINARHNIFLQGGGILNERSVDIDDDEARHTLNFGAAYRYLTVDEKYLLGGNVFFDHQWPYNHSRMSVGADAKADSLNLAANYYIPLTDYRDSRTDTNGNQYEERALGGYDVELGYTLPFLPDLSVFGKGYQYFRDTDDDIRGLELSGEYNLHDNFTLKGSLIEENGGRDGVELALQYRMPLYDMDKANLALAAIETAAGDKSMRSKVFEKIRRENRIRVEERLKEDASANIITAQFSALSVGLPFDVGGAATGAGVDLPFDTAITVLNGDFGIIEFSNGAIANVSASGGGDVILEFNNTTLTVTATNGGFVQFISGSGGGITVVNVPGGMVNLLGTDIDVSDNGVATTVQVRAGMIEVVPTVGAAVLLGNQGDIISLNIGTGATAALVNPALKTRQEDAYTNLDLINPSPPATGTSAPFINVAPTLITGPQFVGNNADLRLTFTQPLTVTGAPFINGLVGVNARTFAYNTGASTPTQLVFRHVLVAGDIPIPASITIQELNLNGGTIIGTANGLNAVTAYTDTAVLINDLTAPMLTGSTPVDNEPAFASSANIVLNFDENVQAGIGNIFITDTTDASDSRIIPIGDARIVIAGSTITINPTGNLDLVNEYDVVIASGVIEDTSGNGFAGISTGNLNFTTANGTVPMFISVTPPAASTYTNGENIDWTLNYDQAVTVTGGPPTIALTLDTGAAVATFASGSGTANLVFRYTVGATDGDTNGVVLANAITPAGATLIDTTSMTQNADTDFTAVNVATLAVLIDQAPTLASSSPVDNATGESVGINAVLTFNENVQAGAGNIVFTDTDDGSGDFTIAVGDVRVGIVGAVVTIDLSAQILEFNTNYEITMASGVFEDTGVRNLPFAALASGALNWQTVVDPTAGFPAATVSMATPTSISGSHENAQDIGTWHTTINVGATPDGVIFESGATGQGIAASFDAVNLVFAAGDGASTATDTDSIFGTYPIASIGQGLHHFVFVADPDAAAEIGVYIDGIRVINQSIAGGMKSGEWAGTNGAGYGLVNSSIRAGVNVSALTGATLITNLSFYTNVAPASF